MIKPLKYIFSRSYNAKDLIAVFIFLFYWLLHWGRLQMDFWNDELYTLDHFVFVNIGSIFTDYHVPNNHVFFNLLNHLFLVFTNVSSLDEVLGNPVSLRILMLIYAMFTCIFIYKTVKIKVDQNTALLALIICLTTLPFLYFSLQVRGYGLSMTLLSLSVYSYYKYLQTKKWPPLLWLIAGTAMLVYTIPSNLYPLAGIMLYTGSRSLFESVKNKKLITPHSKAFLAMILGLATGVACYYPVFDEVFFNGYVKGGDELEWSSSLALFGRVTEYLFSFRYILIPFLIAGIYFMIRQKKVDSLAILTTCAYLTPFVLSLIRNDHAPERIFVVLIPVFSILMALLFKGTYDWLFKNDRNYFITIVILIFYLFGNLTYRQGKVKAASLHHLENGQRKQDLYLQYYSENYYPLKSVQLLAEKRTNSAYPILVDGCEGHGVKYYFKKYKLPYLRNRSLDSLLLLYDSVDVISSQPNSILKNKKYKSRQYSEKLNYHTYLRCFINKPFFNAIHEERAAYRQLFKKKQGILFIGIGEDFLHFVPDSSEFFIENKKNVNKVGMIEFLQNFEFLLNFDPFLVKNEPFYPIINHFFVKIDNLTTGVNSFPLYKRKDVSNNTHFLDFEDIPANSENYNLDDQRPFKGSYSQKMTSNLPYSPGLKVVLSEEVHMKEGYFVPHLYGDFKADSKALLVFEIIRNDKSIFWSSDKLSDYHNSKKDWSTVVASFQYNEALFPGDVIQVYIWNKGLEEFHMDDFGLEETW